MGSPRGGAAPTFPPLIPGGAAAVGPVFGKDATSVDGGGAAAAEPVTPVAALGAPQISNG